MFDVAIIGAGPAGATLGRLIGRRMRVLLLDKRSWQGPAPAGKCCGGLLAPRAQRMLASLGLSLPQGVLDGRQVFAVRAIDVPSGLERLYARNYLNVNRTALERLLLDLVPAEVDLRTGCMFRSAQAVGDGFRVTFTCGGKTFVEHARLVVGADGAGSAVRRQLPGRPPGPARYLAVQEWFDAPAEISSFTAIFDPPTTDYYAWAIPKDGGLLFGAALAPGADALGRFQRLKAKLGRFGMDLSRPIRREAAMLLRPTSVDQFCPVAGGVALIGEAAAFVSPSSGEGISYALHSAAALAAALAPGIDGFQARYLAACGTLRRSIRWKLLKCSLFFRPAVRQAILRCGVRSLGRAAWPQSAAAMALRGGPRRVESS
jgi:flavin-dependent dehydrogenase